MGHLSPIFSACWNALQIAHERFNDSFSKQQHMLASRENSLQENLWEGGHTRIINCSRAHLVENCNVGRFFSSERQSWKLFLFLSHSLKEKVLKGASVKGVLNRKIAHGGESWGLPQGEFLKLQNELCAQAAALTHC